MLMLIMITKVLKLLKRTKILYDGGHMKFKVFLKCKSINECNDRQFKVCLFIECARQCAHCQSS